MIHELEHVVVIANLALSCWVFGVLLLVWNLVEHGAEEHEKSSILFDRLFELFKDRMEGLGVLVHMSDGILKPLLVNSVVLR